jgi:hypothetical protein
MTRLLLILCMPAALAACPVSWQIAPYRTPYNVKPEEFLPARVPGYWDLPARGFAVYRALFGCKTEGLALYLPEVSSAGQAYANGRVISSSGLPAMSQAAEKPRLAPWIIDLNGSQEVLIFVSNFNSRSGGILGARTGLRSEFELERKRALLLETIVTGFLTASGLCFLLFYTVQKQPSYLPFALLMFVCTVRSISSNAVLEETFPHITWTQLRLLLEYQTAVAWMPPLFFLVVHFLFAEQGDEGPIAELRSKLARFTAWVYAPAGLVLSVFFAASFDASFYGRFQPTYVLFYLLPGLALCTILILLFVFERRRGAILLLAGFLCVLFATLADAETTVYGKSGPLFVPLGLACFCISFMIVAGLRLRADQKALLRSQREIELARFENRHSEEQRRSRFEEARQEALLQVNAAVSIAEESPAPERHLLARLYSARRRLDQAGRREGKIVDLASLLGPALSPAMVFAREDGLIELTREILKVSTAPCQIETLPASVSLKTRAAEEVLPHLSKLAARAAGRLVSRDGEIEILFAPAFGPSLSLEERHRLFLSEAG